MADIKTAWGASFDLTFTSLNSLASSSTLLAGASSLAVNVTGASDKFRDYWIGGKIVAGSSPTAGQLLIYLYASWNDTPTYPGIMDGTDSAKTFGDVERRDSALHLLYSLRLNATSSITYGLGGRSLRQALGAMPKYWGLWATHDSAVALAASGHQLTATPIFETAV